MKLSKKKLDEILERLNSFDDEYWEKRFESIQTEHDKKTDELIDEMLYLFSLTQEQILTLIAAYITKYGFDNEIDYYENLKKINRSELREAKGDLDIVQAQLDLEGLEFDKDIQKQIKDLSTKTTRLDTLKLRIRAKVFYLYSVLNKRIYQHMEDITEDSYYRSTYEVYKAAGYGTETKELEELTLATLLAQAWRSTGETFDDAIWRYGRSFGGELNHLFGKLITQKVFIDEVDTNIDKLFRSKQNELKRNVITDSTFFETQGNSESFTTLDIEECVYRAILDDRTCETCSAMDGTVIPVDNIIPWENAPPIHNNCVLPDTVIAAPDCQALTRSEYSGDVIQFFTSNGRRLSITPNHIMLTARGWVRAKNLVEGDKVIYYSDWVEDFINDPANNDSVPTVEELFTTLCESGLVIPMTMPASAEDFKGDVIENSDVNIVFINSLLRDKVDSSFLKFITDHELKTTHTSSILFTSECSLAQCLVGLGLTSDGVMSGLSVANILLSGAFTHHELVSFRLPSDYDMRLFKTVVNNASTNIELLRKSINADTGFVKRDNFINRQRDILRVTNRNIIPNKSFSNSFVGFKPEYLRDFIHTIPGVIEFDNIVRIERSFYSGYVYDSSCFSTLYLTNGFVSSNCRCTLTPIVQKIDWLTGDVYEIEDDYDDWYDKHINKK